ncbi:1-deoxy-D-xylulose-5-phosphate reductoisomerase [Pelagibacterales bacterium SAG-MED41]|nr:1-deoxy-D-xylulose-5-phosphate reductoisomerase [Pelagibacterales bacterium SAG-MED41]
MKKFISILGSTGSIGQSTLRLIDKKKNIFSIKLLCANKNYNLINKQIKKYNPKYFIITDKKTFEKIYKKFKKRKIIILNNFDSIKIKKENHITVSAITGISGLEPTLKMIELSDKVLLANKESVICGWNLIKKTLLKYKTKIIPIDSEHFSTMKLLENHKYNEIEKIYITASGGPFLNLKKKKFKNIDPKDAIKHPKWKMGKKISIDSATLMNKILELIEAQKLFGLPLNKFDIIIHPESLVHSIVLFKNGLTKLLYHETSMTIPIGNALFEKNFRFDKFIDPKKREIKNLTFKKVNKSIFPTIKLKDRLQEFSSTPIIINSANEASVDLFLKKKIPFLMIYKIIMSILNDRNYKKYAINTPNNIHQIKKIDSWVRNLILKKYTSPNV